MWYVMDTSMTTGCIEASHTNLTDVTLYTDIHLSTCSVRVWFIIYLHTCLQSHFLNTLPGYFTCMETYRVINDLLLPHRTIIQKAYIIIYYLLLSCM